MALFQPGNPGKPKGAKNKATKAVDAAFQDVFDELQGNPKASLSTWAKENPGEFYKLMGKKLTTSAENTNHNIHDNVSEAQARAEAEAFIEAQRRNAQRVEPVEPDPLRAEDEAGLPAGVPSLQDR